MAEAAVTGTAVKDYSYCPALPWLKVRLGLREPETWGMRAGRSLRASDVAYKLGLERPWLEEVPLRDRGLGAAGVVDLVSGSGRLRVLEVKAFRAAGERLRPFANQLKFYALLANRLLGRVREAYLYHGGDLLALEVDGHVLREAEELVARVRDVLESEEPPRAYRSERCSSCWFRRVCPAWD
ncbi:CRISPR-associated protein Cas4 [Acidilobus saccharovorans 345-15]|uniref:CRISPR-associated exonuclease Cas4 n=1 Tax=Acidilobus saccharovorans (strain DSM 16705 / JCM 18335 / VKM B-2471 / 345-15) TaxID=666510 RepID=D9PZC5_ACIS3|nr:CRISPR-associated protein Cas4 [Acidilobus saccharovorans]ADL18413.1 CRISPR-associated protein Cas4 [Acidilobus saccharovorans 345-15]